MKELLIIRHARSLQNVGETLHLDEGLTHFGKLQANKVGDFIGKDLVEFKEDKFDVANAVMYISPFLRTLQTAVQIKQRLPKLSAFIAPELGEYVNHFQQEEIYVPVRDKVFPEFDWSGYKGQNYNCIDREWDTGCDDKNHLQRIADFHSRLPEDKPVIIVSHGLPILSLFHFHCGSKTHVPVWDYSISNASITWVKGDKVIWRARDLYFETDIMAEFNEKSTK